APAHPDRHARTRQELPDRRGPAIHPRQIPAEAEDPLALLRPAAGQRGAGAPRREIRPILAGRAGPTHHRPEAPHMPPRPPRRELVEYAPWYFVKLVEDDLATHDWVRLTGRVCRVPGLSQPYVNDCAHVVFWTTALLGSRPTRYPHQFSAPSFGFVSQAFKMMGCSRDGFYRFKESSTSKAANGRSRKSAVRSPFEEPRDAGDRGCRNAGDGAAGLRSGPRCQRAQAARPRGFPRRRALCVAAPRPGDYEQAAQGAGSPKRAWC